MVALMMRLKTCWALRVALCVASVLLFGASAVRADNTEAPLQALREDMQENSISLYQAAAQGAADNFVLSPYVINTAAAMVYAGSAGATAEQLAQAFHWRMPPGMVPQAYHLLDAQLAELIHAGEAAVTTQVQKLARAGKPDDRVVWMNAARLWLKEGVALHEDYEQTLKTHFNAAAGNASMKPGTETIINSWISERTNGLLQNLLSPEAFRTTPAMVEVAVTYLKALWAEPCRKAGERTFFSRANTSHLVPMMRRRAESRLRFADNATFLAVELPYKRDTLSMVIIMPKDEFDTFERGFKPETLVQVMNALHEGSAEVVLPLFEITTPLDLQKTLAPLGVRDLFTQRANLTGLAKTPVFLNAMVEQSRIKVDEQGTEAAAAVASVMMPSAIVSTPNHFVIDHPFIFIIHNRILGVPLFMGRVTSL